MSRTTLTLALLVVTLLAGCTAATGLPAATDTPGPTQSPTASAPAGPSPDEPPLDLDGAADTLDTDEPPHVVRLVNDGDATRNVTLTVARDGATVYEGSFRSFPNTTVLGEIDHVGNYTLTVAAEDGATVTGTLAAESFDCNYSTTTFDLSEPDPSVKTVSTEMACGTPTSDV